MPYSPPPPLPCLEQLLDVRRRVQVHLRGVALILEPESGLGQAQAQAPAPAQQQSQSNPAMWCKTSQWQHSPAKALSSVSRSRVPTPLAYQGGPCARRACLRFPPPVFLTLLLRGQV